MRVIVLEQNGVCRSGLLRKPMKSIVISENLILLYMPSTYVEFQNAFDESNYQLLNKIILRYVTKEFSCYKIKIIY